MTLRTLVDRVSVCLTDLGIDLSSDRPVVAGLSGGVDSTVLLDVLTTLGFQVVAVHVNYRLRAEDSDADERFCRDTCDDLSQELLVFSPTNAEINIPGKSLQEAARDYRYRIFSEAASEVGALLVFLGHHANDNAETLLLNLFRGTGLNGLGGMPQTRDLDPSAAVKIVRPLLGFQREEIESFARQQGIAWRTDVSNLDESYGRGFIRSRILPQIVEGFGKAAFGNVARTAETVRQYVEADHSILVGTVFKGVTSGKNRLSVSSLQLLPAVWQDYVIKEAVNRWTNVRGVDRHTITSIRSLMQSQTGRKTKVEDCLIVRDRDDLVFEPRDLAETELTSRMILTIDGTVHNQHFTLRSFALKTRPKDFDTRGQSLAFVRRSAFPLTVRTWRAGDKMVLPGSGQRKNISDILTDAYARSVHKSERWVVESDEGILWVPGAARSDIDKIGPETSEVVLLTYIEET